MSPRVQEKKFFYPFLVFWLRWLTYMSLTKRERIKTQEFLLGSQERVISWTDLWPDFWQTVRLTYSFWAESGFLSTITSCFMNLQMIRLCINCWITLRIAHLRIAHWGAISRWAILSPSVIRIAHLNYYVLYVLFVLDIGHRWVLGTWAVYSIIIFS